MKALVLALGLPLGLGACGAGAGGALPCGTSQGDDGLRAPVPNPPGLGLPHEARTDTSAADTVKDLVTGLVWQRAVDGGRYAQEDAARFCEQLKLPGGPWRLPTLPELVSLVDDTRANPSIDPAAFPGTPGTYFWTSTPRAGSASGATTSATTSATAMGWNVYFGLGDAYYYDVTDPNAVRCVAAPVRPNRGCLVASAGTVTDGDTQLTWQQATDGALRTWDEATAYCQALPLAGGGWRLPRVNELRSLVDYARTAPALDPTLFPDAPAENFWTASPFARTPGNAWYVYFDDGFAGYNVMTSRYAVRCVR